MLETVRPDGKGGMGDMERMKHDFDGDLQSLSPVVAILSVKGCEWYCNMFPLILFVLLARLTCLEELT